MAEPEAGPEVEVDDERQVVGGASRQVRVDDVGMADVHVDRGKSLVERDHGVIGREGAKTRFQRDSHLGQAVASEGPVHQRVCAQSLKSPTTSLGRPADVPGNRDAQSRWLTWPVRARRARPVPGASGRGCNGPSGVSTICQLRPARLAAFPPERDLADVAQWPAREDEVAVLPLPRWTLS